MPTDEGSHENGYLLWKMPEFLDSINKVDKTQVAVGVNGKLQQTHLSGLGNTSDSATEQSDYVVQLQNSIFQIRIPYNADGGQKKVEIYLSLAYENCVLESSKSVHIFTELVV